MIAKWKRRKQHVAFWKRVVELDVLVEEIADILPLPPIAAQVLQKLGSFVVRMASSTPVADAPAS